jgi:hypothetical protein
MDDREAGSQRERERERSGGSKAHLNYGVGRLIRDSPRSSACSWHDRESVCSIFGDLPGDF